jgi:HD-GYP domain-containing protein (c-di-GMP phosphodiesterase class II)
MAPATVSVLRCLNTAASELDAMLAGLTGWSDADPALRQIARAVTDATASAPDVAMACVLLNQIGGRYAVRHCVDAAIVACQLARALHKPEPEVIIIAAAALTMNVGMMGQIEEFQNKTAALNPDERTLVMLHPCASAQLLTCAGVSDEQWLECVLQHHEHEDGSGYPEGRRHEDITLNAKLVGLADRYTACVSARNYRRSMTPPLALDKLCADTGNAPALTRLLRDEIGACPPGTLVRLANGDAGVVAGRGADRQTLLVHVLRCADGKPLSEVRGTDAPDCEVECALHEDAAHLRFSMKTVWGDLAALL